MKIIEAICHAVIAPFYGVYEHLDEHIDNTAIVMVLYFVWCALLGWMFALGGIMTYAIIIYAKFSKE